MLQEIYYSYRKPLIRVHTVNVNNVRVQYNTVLAINKLIKYFQKYIFLVSMNPIKIKFIIIP